MPGLLMEASRQYALSPERGAKEHEDRELLRRYHRDGDIAAREQLVTRFLPLARSLALRYKRGNEPIDDLFQVASLALVKAVDRFDPEREVAFSSFAVPTIAGEIKRYFRDHAWAVRVPRGLQERILEVDRAVGRLSRELGRSPTPSEIAESVELNVEEVLEAMEASSAASALSMEAEPAREADDGRALSDTLGYDEEGYERVENREAVTALLRGLDEREREILRLRFVEGLSQQQIGEQIGVSQMHVSRLLRRALARLRPTAEAHWTG
jgi:RNA polymerase sigma-B factor